MYLVQIVLKMSISVIEEDGVKKYLLCLWTLMGMGHHLLDQQNLYTVSSENGEATSYAVVNFKPTIPSISISSVNSK